jgi:hypothetical protein
MKVFKAHHDAMLEGADASQKRTYRDPSIQSGHNASRDFSQNNSSRASEQISSDEEDKVNCGSHLKKIIN